MLKKLIITTMAFLLMEIGVYAENLKNTIKITSPVFEYGEYIPSAYTCMGKDMSPPINWQGVPRNAKSLVLICDDPDAPMGTWVHWVIYNIPPDSKGLPEGIPGLERLKDGTLQGINDFRKIGYGGPCPPGGVHRYYFKIYAIDTMLNIDPGATKKRIMKLIEGHIISKGELMGRFKR